MVARIIQHQRQYEAPGNLARQLQERDREVGLLFDRLLTDLRATATAATNVAGLYVRPEAYGAKRDGVTTDHGAFAKAFDVAAESGRPILLGSGTYLISTALMLRAERLRIIGQGASTVLLSGTDNTNILDIDDSEHITILGVTFRGNRSGLGGAFTRVGGHGINITDSGLIDISGCVFEGIGHTVTAGYASPVQAQRTSALTVTRCYFASDCRNTTGADLLINNAVTDAIVSLNRSESETDTFVSLSGQGAASDGSDRIRHTITSNIARRTGETARHGILALYNANPGHSTIANNVLDGFIWNGVYISTGVAGSTTEEPGGITVSGNVIRHCGGESTGITAGIYCGGYAGGTVSNNYIYRTGYKSDNTTRTQPTAGIMIPQYAKNWTVVGNAIRRSTHYGVWLSSVAAGDIEDCNIVGNIITECQDVSIRIASGSSSSEIRRILVANNLISQPGFMPGIEGRSDNSGPYSYVRVEGNTVRCTASSLSGFDYGIMMRGSASVVNNVHVKHNFVRGFVGGIHMGGNAHLRVPTDCVIDGNHIEDTTLGVSVSDAAQYGVHFNNTFKNVTTPCPSLSRPGRWLQHPSGRVLELFQDGAPAGGAWLLGDRVMRRALSGGTIQGHICTTAGTPGTWTDITI